MRSMSSQDFDNAVRKLNDKSFADVSSADQQVRLRAVHALLSTIPNTNRPDVYIEALILLLNDLDREVRREAARALGAAGNRNAVGALLEAYDKYSNNRYNVIGFENNFLVDVQNSLKKLTLKFPELHW